jgi:hypothetical protein
MAYFAVLMLALIGSLALYFGVTWKTHTGKNRWGQEIGISPGEKWY